MQKNFPNFGSVISTVALCALATGSLAAGCSSKKDAPAGNSTGNTSSGGSSSGGTATGGSGTGGTAGSTGGAGGSACAVVGQVAIPANNFVCTCPGFTPDECPTVGCVNLQTNAANCGTCGTVCDPGAACSGGHCTMAPTEVATLTGCMNPRMILSGTTFYFTDTGTGKVSSMPVAGGAVTDIATAQMLAHPAPVGTEPDRTKWPAAIAVDTAGVYWSNMGDNTIMKAPLPTGAAAPLITLDSPARGLAVGGNMLYFTHVADIFKIPTTGPSATADAGAGGLVPIVPCNAADTADGKMPIDPPGAQVPGATYVAGSNESCSPSGLPAALAVNGTDIAYTVDVREAVEQNLLAGGSYHELGESVNSLLPEIIAVNDTHAFYGTDSFIKEAMLNVDHTAPTVTHTLKFDKVLGFTVSATHAYVAATDGSIARSSLTIPTAPAEVMVEGVASAQVDPKWLVNDGTNLYWIGSDCKIMKTAMPQ